ncbi:MAG: DNA gyrase inhibitor YacG [Thermodesulfovibrionales bacterium]|nr:DNA gyrase inhibitor YacG [Thermodesulfovibrionales bacterium]
MMIRCPICGALTTWQENENRPFCSQRCKLIDLGKWVSEEYKVVEPLDEKDKSTYDICHLDEENKQ